MESIRLFRRSIGLCLTGVLALCLALGSLLSLPRPAQADFSSPPPLYPSPNERFGFCAVYQNEQIIASYDVAQFNAAWYLDFWRREQPQQPARLDYAQMIRVGEPWYRPEDFATEIGPLIDANPGSLWLVGNEPDRTGIQDSRTPEEYAVIYHDVYYFIKQRDPTARVAIGGIVQPTPLRLLYLDFVLQEYEARYGATIPIDVWNIHNFILREDYTWGAGIPPGMDAYASMGKLYNWWENASIAIFQQQVQDFRQWMADNGQRDKPLIITEYGVLMPEVFGFNVNIVTTYMRQTFDYLLNAVDPELGYPADDNRLVQQWFWYSLDEDACLEGYGCNRNNMIDAQTGQLTTLGQAYADYTADLIVPYVDTTISKSLTPLSATTGDLVTYTVKLANAGNSLANGVAVSDVLPAGLALVEVSSAGVLVSGTDQSTWTVSDMPAWTGGTITVTAQVTAVVPAPQVITNTAVVGANGDVRPGNNSAAAALTLLPGPCPACDVDGNGVIDIRDVQKVAGRWLDGAHYAPQYDIWPRSAPDGVIDVLDVTTVAAQWNGTVP